MSEPEPKPEPIRVGLSLPCAPRRAFGFLDRPEWFARWFGREAALEPQVGGAFALRDRATGGEPSLTQGRVLVIDPPQLLTLEWKGQDWERATVARFRFEETGPGRTWLTIEQDGFERFSDRAAAERLRDAALDAWRARLAALEAVALG